jgi:ElaB/YqjD/DUF883 family membrane-anchored ribosome-binding protein
MSGPRNSPPASGTPGGTPKHEVLPADVAPDAPPLHPIDVDDPTGPPPAVDGATTAAPVAADRPVVSPPDERSPEEIRDDIGELRSELGDTVEELVHRVDVPARLREKKDETTERVQQQVTQAREVIAEKAPAVDTALRERPGAVAGGVAVLLGLLMMRRRRRRRARARARA